MNQQIVGQPKLIENMLIALLVNGHLLVEGPPGLAKTRAVNALSNCIEGSFHRIQFTPDLLPSDLTGTDIFRPETGQFEFQQGPLFNHVILADEINRAPAKVQSALLEAMAERQITVGNRTYPLPDIFLVMATQNPLDQEGTYALPEAQLDRFVMHVEIHYPGFDAEKEILHLARAEGLHNTVPLPTPMSEDNIKDARQAILDLSVSPAIEDYMLHLIMATRTPSDYMPDYQHYFTLGVSPRATIALDHCARAHAYLGGRHFVAPDNVHAVFHDVMRHRLTLSYEAEMAGMNVNAILDLLLQSIPVP
jgi:MoxR-like ATPase